MKKRNGWVSNSSTCSFVLVGFDGSGLMDEDTFWAMNEAEGDYDWLQKEGFTMDKAKFDAFSKMIKDFSVLYGTDDGLRDGEMVIGEEIVAIYSDDGYIQSGTVKWDDVYSRVEQIQQQVGAGDKPILIYYGTRVS